jgi:hypothetical protein
MQSLVSTYYASSSSSSTPPPVPPHVNMNMNMMMMPSLPPPHAVTGAQPSSPPLFFAPNSSSPPSQGNAIAPTCSTFAFFSSASFTVCMLCALPQFILCCCRTRRTCFASHSSLRSCIHRGSCPQLLHRSVHPSSHLSAH